MSGRSPTYFLPNHIKDLFGPLVSELLVNGAGYTAAHFGKWHIGPKAGPKPPKAPKCGTHRPALRAPRRVMPPGTRHHPRGRDSPTRVADRGKHYLVWNEMPHGFSAVNDAVRNGSSTAHRLRQRQPHVRDRTCAAVSAVV